MKDLYGLQETKVSHDQYFNATTEPSLTNVLIGEFTLITSLILTWLVKEPNKMLSEPPTEWLDITWTNTKTILFFILSSTIAYLSHSNMSVKDKVAILGSYVWTGLETLVFLTFVSFVLTIAVISVMKSFSWWESLKKFEWIKVNSRRRVLKNIPIW